MLVLPTPANASGKSRALTSQSWNLGDYGTQYLLTLTKSSLKTWLLKKKIKKLKTWLLAQGTCCLSPSRHNESRTRG